MSIKSGSTDISKIYGGSTAASKVYVGSTLVWSSAPPAVLTAMKITKNADQVIVNNSTDQTIQPWIADAAYASTVLSSGNAGLKANGAGTWNISVRTTWSDSRGAGANRTLSLYKNGVQYGASVPATTTSNVRTASWSGVPVALNDVITVMTRTAHSFPGNNIVGGTGTWIEATI